MTHRFLSSVGFYFFPLKKENTVDRNIILYFLYVISLCSGRFSPAFLNQKLFRVCPPTVRFYRNGRKSLRLF
ncbi:hypothetical protein LEP1GSC060_0800 [Leptospira weilii serovar Ranarum str. ICFT]|uniref:Uncharacterized protein n=1 Tax=Leptospira weilii serovar Ranarum str. ICFT TaxID=1218598 RepID=N1WNV2_9LEPT|nr:hypothetical protein LEP1GSC060_0800 [Leptospira weilii serovar Ranarum str. ICFT]